MRPPGALDPRRCPTCEADWTPEAPQFECEGCPEAYRVMDLPGYEWDDD